MMDAARTRCASVGTLLLVHLCAAAAIAGPVRPTDEQLARLTRQLQQNPRQALDQAEPVFCTWVDSRPESRPLRELRQRINALRSLRDRIVKTLEPANASAAQNMVDDLLSGQTSKPAAGTSRLAATPPEQLYAEYLPSFMYALDTGGLLPAEMDFAGAYYNAEARSMIDEVLRLGVPLASLSQGAWEVEGYLLLLPLMQNPARFDVALLGALPDRMLTPERLAKMADFCLLRVGRLDAAAAIATRAASRSQPSEAAYQYYLVASTRCASQHKPVVAAECLKEAIKCLPPDDPRVLEHRFEICSAWAAEKNYAMAASEAGQIAKQYGQTPGFGKAMYLLVRYHSEQVDSQSVLLEVDDAIASEHCRPYLAELLYLKWIALRKEGKGEKASLVLKKFLSDYPSNAYAAEMYYAVAVDCLSAQRYDEAQRILRSLVEQFPESKVARRAEPLIGKLAEFAQKPTPTKDP